MEIIDLGWPWRLLTTSVVGCSSDSWASCYLLLDYVHCVRIGHVELVGSTYFTAPEVLLHQSYSRAADIWSAGVVMYLLLCGRLPFDGDLIHQSICQGAFDVRNMLDTTTCCCFFLSDLHMSTSLACTELCIKVEHTQAYGSPYVHVNAGHFVLLLIFISFSWRSLKSRSQSSQNFATWSKMAAGWSTGSQDFRFPCHSLVGRNA